MVVLNPPQFLTDELSKALVGSGAPIVRVNFLHSFQASVCGVDGAVSNELEELGVVGLVPVRHCCESVVTIQCGMACAIGMVTHIRSTPNSFGVVNGKR